MIDIEKERKAFISIRELVVLIATETGKTEQQAAAMLAANLARHQDWQRLTLCEFSPIYGLIEFDEPNCKRENQMRSRLENWARSGNSQKLTFADFDDDIPF